MTSRRGRNDTVITSAALGAALLLPAGASAYCWNRTGGAAQTAQMPCPSDGVPLHWRQRCIDLQLSRYGLPEFLGDGETWTEGGVRSTLQVAFRQWEDLQCARDNGFVVRIVDGLNDEEAIESRDARRFTSAVIFQKEWASLDYPSAAFAITTTRYWPDSGEIFTADIEINQPNHDFVDCASRACQGFDVDLQNVLTHEAGHVFGLSHSKIADATMFPNTAPGNMSLRTLESDDTAGFCALYAMFPIESEQCPYSTNIDLTPDKGCAVGAQGRNEAPVPKLAVLAALVLAARKLRRRR